MVGAGYRGCLSTIASWILRFSIKIPNITDYTIFYRAYKMNVLRKGFDTFKENFISGAGFSCMANMLINTITANPGIKIAEVPLTLRYDLKEGGSGIQLFRTALGYFKIIKSQRSSSRETK